MLNEHLKYLNKSNDYHVGFPVCTDKKTKLQLMKYGFWMEALYDEEITPISSTQFEFCQYCKRLRQILNEPQTLKSLDALRSKIIGMNPSKNLWKEFFFQRISSLIKLKKIKREQPNKTYTREQAASLDKEGKIKFIPETEFNATYYYSRTNKKSSYKDTSTKHNLHKEGKLSFYDAKKPNTGGKKIENKKLESVRKINKTNSYKEDLYPKHYNKNFKNFTGINKKCKYCGNKLTTSRVKNAIEYCVNCSNEDRDFVSDTPFYSREDYKKMKKMMFKNTIDNHKS